MAWGQALGLAKSAVILAGESALTAGSRNIPCVNQIRYQKARHASYGDPS